MENLTIKSQYEIERGKPMPSKNHGLVQGNLYFEIRIKYGKQYTLITEASILFNGSERVPDIAVYKSLKVTPGQDEIRLKEVPLSAMEILSPKQNLGDLLAKAYLYFEAGIKSYWLIVPDLRSIYIFSSPTEYEIYGKKGKVLDPQLGIELDLKDIFG